MPNKKAIQKHEAAFYKSVASSVEKAKAMPAWKHMNAWVIQATKGPEAAKQPSSTPSKAQPVTSHKSHK